MRKTDHGTGGYYHIFNRGVDQRDIFLDEEDREKLFHSLYLFNDTEYKNTGSTRFHNDALIAGSDVLHQFRKPFVSILSYCLCDNHFHLLIRQNVDQGVERFLHKLQMGFAKYFNKKYGRTGRLFESEYRSVPVETDAHFLHLPRYIHLNALDGSAYEWRDGQIQDWSAAMATLDAYPWSSHHYYCGRPQELQVLDEQAIGESIDLRDYERFLREWATRPLPADVEMLLPDVTQ